MEVVEAYWGWVFAGNDDSSGFLYNAERMEKGEGMPELSNRLAGANHYRISDLLAANPWVFRLAKLGYASNGLLYFIFGATAALATINIGGRVMGTRDALDLLVTYPAGRLVVTIITLGLCGFIIRCFVQIFVLPTIGVPPKPILRVLRRTGCAITGIAHIGIALTALQLTLGLPAMLSDERPPQPDWVTMVLSWKLLSGWLPMLAGFGVIGLAIYQFYVAVNRRFTIDMQLERMSQRVRRATFVCGITGYAGRGTAFLIIGLFLIYAGWYVEEVEAESLRDIINMLEGQSFGRWIMIVSETGLVAYGLFLLLVAWYLRQVASW